MGLNKQREMIDKLNSNSQDAAESYRSQFQSFNIDTSVINKSAEIDTQRSNASKILNENGQNHFSNADEKQIEMSY